MAKDRISAVMLQKFGPDLGASIRRMKLDEPEAMAAYIGAAFAVHLREKHPDLFDEFAGEVAASNLPTTRMIARALPRLLDQWLESGGRE